MGPAVIGHLRIGLSPATAICHGFSLIKRTRWPRAAESRGGENFIACPRMAGLTSDDGPAGGNPARRTFTEKGNNDAMTATVMNRTNFDLFLSVIDSPSVI